MQIRFKKTTTYNILGADTSRISAKKGDKSDVPSWLGHSLIKEGKAEAVGVKPVETKDK